MSHARPEMHLTPEHLALLRRMQIVWIPIEAGAPYPHPEHTYGSSDVIGDALRILREARGGRGELTPLEAQDFHDEALALLPEFIARGSLKPGKYTYTMTLPPDEWGLTPWASRHRIAPDARQIHIDVRAEQIALLKHLRFSSGSDIPVNVKRPYGDMTAFELDMAELLGIKSDSRDSGLSEAQRTHLDELHESLEGVMQVWVQNTTINIEPASRKGEHRPKPDPVRFLSAVARKDDRAVKEMLPSGVDPLARDSQKRSAVELAINNNDHATLGLLLAQTAIINAPQGKYSRTPLMMAAEKGDIETFRLVLKSGGDLSVADEYGRTPLGFAFLNGRDEIIDLILSMGRAESASLGIVGYQPRESQAMKQPPHATGVPVRNVLMGSAADRAGLKQDDLLTAVDGAPLADFPSLRGSLSSKKAGDNVKLSIQRLEERFDVEVRLGPPMGGALKYQSGSQLEVCSAIRGSALPNAVR